MSNIGTSSNERKSSNDDSKHSKKKRRISLDNIPSDQEQSRTDFDTPSSEVIPSFGDDNANTEETLDAAAKKKKRTRKRQKSKRNDGESGEAAVVETITRRSESVSTTPEGITTGTTTDSIVTDGSDEIDRTVYMEGIPFHATYEQIVEFLTRPHADTPHLDSTDDTNTHTDHSTMKRTKILRNEIMDIRLPIWQDTGRYRGYGHVVFTTKEIQQFSIQQLHQQYFFVNSTVTGSNHDNYNKKNRYISISQAKSNRPSTSSTAPATDQTLSNPSPTLSEPSKTIIIRNLSYQATEEDVFHALEGLNTSGSLPFTTPTLESGQIRIVRHTIPPYRSKGMAYITFPNLNDAIHCITCIQQKSSTAPFSICQRTITHFDYDHGRIKGSFRTAQHTFWSTTYRNSSNTNNNNYDQQPRSMKNRMNK